MIYKYDLVRFFYTSTDFKALIKKKKKVFQKHLIPKRLLQKRTLAELRLK